MTVVKMKWATVTGVSPLRVTLDGDSDALPFVPDSLVDPAALVVNDRVRCELSNRRVVIVGRSGGDGFIGQHMAGEWASSPSPLWVLANGAVLNIADYPKLAAHYAATYGSANHHGGNGSTTFAVPDTRERAYVNQGGSDIFATIGSATGQKEHAHPLSDAGQAAITNAAGGLTYFRTISGGFSATTVQSGNTRAGSSVDTTQSTGLQGQTDSASTVQPSFVCRYIIRAA